MKKAITQIRDDGLVSAYGTIGYIIRHMSPVRSDRSSPPSGSRA